jgi:hypothetical protein
MRCQQSNEIIFVVRELEHCGVETLRDDSYSLLYLQSKFELAGMNTCGSCRCMFCYSVTKMGKKNIEQRYEIKFCVKPGEGATDTYEKIPKPFDTLKYFDGTKDL